MRIGLLSDSHGDAAATERAVALLAARGAEAFIHCGDVCSLAVLDALVGRQAWFVWGNCDAPDAAARRYVERIGLPWPNVPLDLALAGRRIRVLHGHERAFRAALAAADVDYLVHGHTHIRADRRVGSMRVINPGALHRAAVHSVALLDLADDSLAFLALDGSPVSAEETR